MKRRMIALVGAALLAGMVSTTALAVAPPGTVTVHTDGCTFSVLIDLDQQYDIVGWKVKQFDPVNWNEGLTLFKGSGPTDAAGVLNVGPFTAPEGHYNVAVDNEYPPDGSSIVVDFWLSCPAATATATATATPTATATGTELPIQGTPTPTVGGGNAGATPPPTGGVEGLTPPPTDTSGTLRQASDSGWQLIVLTLAALGGAALMLAHAARRASARASRARRHR